MARRGATFAKTATVDDATRTKEGSDRRVPARAVAGGGEARQHDGAAQEGLHGARNDRAGIGEFWCGARRGRMASALKWDACEG